MARRSCRRQQAWRQLRWAHANVSGGVYVLTMHPQAIGRGHRLEMLERLIDATRSLDGVAFERVGDFAERWRDEHPIDAWLATQPVHARRHGAPA